MLALLLPAFPGVAGDVGTFSGSNSLSISLADMDFATFSLSDVLSISWRYGRLGFTSTTAFSSAQGPVSQDFRASLPLGETLIQGGAFFSQSVFSRASLNGSGAVGDGINLAATLLLANVGSVQTPDYGFGTTFRVSGAIPDLLRWMVQAGIGATPGGQALADFCFGGARLSLTDVPFCSGRLSLDLVIPPTAPFADDATGEFLTWTSDLPLGDFKLRASVSCTGLLDYQSTVVSVAGTLGGMSVYGNVSFDDAFAFTRGGWQASGPLFDGDVSSSVSLDPSGIVGISLSYTFPFLGTTVTLQPEITFPLLVFGPLGGEFEIPSLRVDLRYPVTCCGGISLGDLSASATVSKTSIDSVSITYVYRF